MLRRLYCSLFQRIFPQKRMGGVCTASERWGKGTSLGGEERNRSTILNANVLIFKVISYLPLQVRRDVSDLKFPTPANKSKEHSLKKKKRKHYKVGYTQQCPHLSIFYQERQNQTHNKKQIARGNVKSKSSQAQKAVTGALAPCLTATIFQGVSTFLRTISVSALGPSVPNSPR